ncbi:uncharacterized protein (DUF2164 family) [Paenibacillus endophyticus]|uniref:Uncharacterized protein (DUF2164 family) n=1 Tax=Paenibacillus endophyticus TaxID=1294268 RepID=A0A7W5GAB3_9BACL|nr:DUF2164 domain-containing protein [Paenibacillus endophyticus]MBB3153054.1 uncharacterized protein (DUF2164 family) [Paenibacillus endophyticus]
MFMMKLPKEQKEQLTGKIQQYFELERSETIGSIAAEQLLDFVIQEIGPHLYNHAISDARKAVLERMQTLEDELYALEKPITTKR